MSGMASISDPPTVPELVAEARAGSDEAFAELVRQHHKAVRGFLGRYVRQAAVVDDLAQEVFLAAFNSLNTFQGERPFAGWLAGIARNRALNHLRSEARRLKHEGHAGEAKLAEWQAEHAEILDPDEALAEQTALKDCLNGMPNRSRNLIRDFYDRGQTAAEIGESLGKSDTLIRMTLLRLRRSPAGCIEKKLQKLKSAGPRPNRN